MPDYMLPDGFKHSLCIFENFVIPKPQYCVTLLLKIVIPLLISHVNHLMLTAIKFYHQLYFGRYEICYIGAKWLLSSKLDLFKLTISKIFPQQFFSIC